ncbi:hypothetical protein H6G33_02495 [Calothrix sp. FACHB-1219]|uniref:hypothetical protein n=1 Tax=unclassified Calothrix TaxID=2619626 RepID=UPI001689DABD|nr:MULTISPECIES: hypothetical protein [unclassified Calothrix]MBD2201475.1 hypothetical protein [Calothrix sp. FACHB-168]MBD2215907.1 hypothetical protein [Calothrix sp. FACHB-1219]
MRQNWEHPNLKLALFAVNGLDDAGIIAVKETIAKRRNLAKIAAKFSLPKHHHSYESKIRVWFYP